MGTDQDSGPLRPHVLSTNADWAAKRCRYKLELGEARNTGMIAARTSG